MSPNQSYSPGSAGFVHPTGNSVKTKKGAIHGTNLFLLFLIFDSLCVNISWDTNNIHNVFLQILYGQLMM